MVIRKLFASLMLLTYLLSHSSTLLAQEQPAAADAPNMMLETPETVVGEAVASYSIAGTKLFWQNLTAVNCDPDVSSKTYDEFIRRVAVQGSTTRTLFEARSTDGVCGPSITSNIVADSDYVYFVRGNLHRMSVLANPGDVVPTVDADISGRAELLIRGAHLYALTESKGLWRVDRESAAATRLLTAAQVGNAPANFQSDGKYAYWLVGGQLRQMNFESSEVLNFGATGITNYTLYSTICLTDNCEPVRFVYIGVGNQIRRFDANTRLFDKDIWTANGSEHLFDEMVIAGNHLFFVEEQKTTCEPFCSHNTLLFRMQRDGNGTPELIYTGQGALGGTHTLNQLTAHGDYLYWIDGFSQVTLKRLPKDAAALPLTNLRITDVEVVQTIQSLDNSIPIIEKKRTFVRVHAKSDGAPVEGVTARLYRLDLPNGNVIGDPLIPTNPTGQYLTLQPDPNRAVLDHSFLFELPMSWVEGSNNLLDHLYLRAEINPYKTPPQASYAYNLKEQVVFLSNSPRFDIRFALFRYTVADTLFEVDEEIDFDQTLSWLRRAYPVASTPIYITSDGPGFGYYRVVVTDNDLKRYITREECDADDDMCASDYVHGLLEDWDDEWPHDHAMMYGIMPTYISPYSGKVYFPRGSTSGDTSNGPSGDPGDSWDVDGTYADWYAGHEIGHLLDRDHPTPGGDPDTGDNMQVGCGHSQDDDSYPYGGARIDGSTYFGFDPGNPQNTAIMTPTVYAGDGAFDVMSYCDPIKWISDYTYQALYDEMFDLAAQAAVISPAATGDYLYLYGVIEPAEEEGHFVRVRRKNGSYTPPAAAATDYAIQMLDGGGAVLATVDVPTSVDPDKPQRLLLQADLPFAAGTRTVQLVHKPSGKTTMSHSLSANAPVVENVALAATTNPVSGTVALSWSASDADNDTLTFDLHYSTDNGATFQPLQANLTSTSAQINTLELGGSSQARLRVTASDGGNTAIAMSEAFALANKPPMVKIANPADGLHVEYGQLINLIGDAWDPQWAPFAESDLRWSSQDGPLGTGATLSLTDLEVGQHTITFRAKNSAGLESSAGITVFVDDDLALPGPTLSVAPAQLGWHFDVGATTPQSATLTIANVGSGSFSWTASTPAPWLTLSANQGSGPGQITVTADPSQIPDGESASTNVFVTASIGVGELSLIVGQATVPAHAVFGEGAVAAAFPGPESSAKIYLPSIEAQP